MNAYIKMAEKNLKSAMFAYEKNKIKPGITQTEIENLQLKIEYAEIVYSMMVERYGD